MLKFITNILLATPIKVWLILFYLIYTGIKAIKPQTMWLPKLFIVPFVIILLSIIGLLSHMQYTQHAELWNTYLIPCILGIIIGLCIYRNNNLIVDKTKWLVTLQGDYTTLILFIAIFLLNYFCLLNYCWGYMESTNPNFFTPDIIRWKVASSGILSGVSIGRMAFYFYKFFKKI